MPVIHNRWLPTNDPSNPQEEPVTPVRSFDIRLRFAMSTSRLPEETLFSFRRNVETKLFFVGKVGGQESGFSNWDN